jgi:hypothetical protein
MTSRISKLVFAAVLAATLPAAAVASACEHDRDSRREAAWRDPRHPGPEPARGWRERELFRVRAELRALEAERADFHARFGWNLHKLRRYDRVYLERRTALQRRWSELQLVAWR